MSFLQRLSAAARTIFLNKPLFPDGSGPQFSFGGWMHNIRQPSERGAPHWCEVCRRRVDLEAHAEVRDVDSTRFFLVRHHYFCLAHDPIERLRRERPNG